MLVFQPAEAVPFFFVGDIIAHPPVGDCAGAGGVTRQVSDIQEAVERVFPRWNNAFDYVVSHGKALAQDGSPFDTCENEAVANRASFQALGRVLEEQCTVNEEKTAVTLKAKTGGAVMQNPSDAEATYDGHKGAGYQAQIAESCNPDNEVQLITGVDVEPAHESDQDAAGPMLDQLEGHGRQPDVMYADTGYGRDENVVAAEARGVDLQSPVGGSPPRPQTDSTVADLTVDDFVIDEATETVERCPNNCVPESSVHDSQLGRTRTVMAASDCGSCAFGPQCPVKRAGKQFVLEHTPRQRRLAGRRAEQATDAFRQNYSIRAGGESVNSGLKRRTGMGRVRTRGQPRVRMAVLLRCAGWNVFRALAALKKRGIRDLAAFAATLGPIARALGRPQPLTNPLLAASGPISRRFSPAPVLAAA